MEKLEITLDCDLSGYFREIVKDVVKGRSMAPEPIVEEYLLGLLTDSALGDVPIQSADRIPLSVQLASAMQADHAVRFERLRQLGDGVLLLGGLYQPHLERVGLEDSYVARIGERAYGAASALMTRDAYSSLAEPLAAPHKDVLRELSLSFQQLMHLLRDVADAMLASAARSSADFCFLVERWVKTRSAHLGRLLRGQGIVLSGVC